MKYAVQHVTTYTYDQAVALCHNLAHIVPRSHAWQKCLSCEVSISPQPMANDSWTDFFGNETRFFSLESPHDHLEIKSHSIVEVTDPATAIQPDSPPWEKVVEDVALAADEASRTAVEFTLDSPFVKRKQIARQYAAESFPPNRPLYEAVTDLTRRIAEEFRYDNTATSVDTPTHEVFENRRGVCQDFAHLQVCCLRSLGLAARYVSGYLFTDPPPGKPKLIGGDASHAWVSVFCPRRGWFDVDPTNSQPANARHITVAWGRDYGDVCPVKGVLIGAGHQTMRVAVDVSII